MSTKTRSISTKQLAIIVFIMGAANKLFMLPVVMLKVGGRYTWASLAIFLALDFITLLLFLLISHKCPKKTAFEILEQKLGVVASKIIMSIVVICIFVKLIHLLLVIGNFTLTNLFDGMPMQIILFPLCLMLAIMGFSSLRAIGRTSEIFIVFILISLLSLMVLVVSSSEFYKLFPLVGDDNGNFVGSLKEFPIWFGDAGAMFIVLGNVKKDKHFNKKIIIVAVVTMVVIYICSLLIYAMYIDIASLSDYGRRISAITHISVVRLNTGRFDKINFLIWIVSIIITLAIFFFSATRSAQFVVPSKQSFFQSIALAVAIYVVAIMIDINLFYEIVDIIGVYIAGLLQIIFPIVLLCCCMKKREKVIEK